VGYKGKIERLFRKGWAKRMALVIGGREQGKD
jgi:hypothetical protein